MVTRNTRSNERGPEDQSAASKRSEAAIRMRTAPTREERSQAARELSNSRTQEQKTAAGRKGGQSRGGRSGSGQEG